MKKSLKGISKTPLLLFLACLPALSKAQSVVGSWHLIDMKGVATDKATGKKGSMDGEEMKEMKEMLDYNCTLNADNTMSFSLRLAGGKPLETKGTYVMAGDKFTAHVEMEKKYKAAAEGNSITGFPNYVTISFSGGNMIWHYAADINDDGKNLHAEMEWVWRRK